MDLDIFEGEFVVVAGVELHAFTAEVISTFYTVAEVDIIEVIVVLHLENFL